MLDAAPELVALRVLPGNHLEARHHRQHRLAVGPLFQRRAAVLDQFAIAL